MRLIAFILWVVLLTPAMNIGKAWQSSAKPGPVVTVNFKTGPVDGQMFYKTNGDAWLRDAKGTEYRLAGTETIVAGVRSSQERSVNEIISSTWRGIAPTVLITMLLLGVQFRREN